MHFARTSLRALVTLAALLVVAPGALHAQDTTTRGVRIGLSYDPSGKPGIIVLPV